MENHKIVSHDAWLEARKALLAKEKEFTRLRDALTKERRELPWERVEKPYVFEGPQGKETLSDLFEGRHQLIIYHFMFGPDWEEGCPSCSYLADHFNPAIVHLNRRDINRRIVRRQKGRAGFGTRRIHTDLLGQSSTGICGSGR